MSRNASVLSPRIKKRVGSKKRGWRRKHLRERVVAEKEEKVSYERAQSRFKQWLRRNPTADEETPRLMLPSLDS